MPESIEVLIAGERMFALGEKALLWPERSTLFVADVHLGKDSAMIASSIPVPLGATTESLCRLSRLIEQTGVSSLVLLGDLWHAKAGRSDQVYGEFVVWTRMHAGVKMTLVEGNHDIKAGPLTAETRIEEVSEPFRMSPFVLCHVPQVSDDGYVLAGHIHPGVVLEGFGRQSIKLPCFWFGNRMCVLPAFGEFTGCARVAPVEGDRVLVVANGQVLPVQTVVAEP
ncbi:MAG: ligase-associated DNA damage response endonuclease PdeM [Fimbriimonas sp.]|nr:ligase-associated DNA damage response endonuclease PdeM [Fimbriimonas sp.]